MLQTVIVDIIHVLNSMFA